MIISIFMTNITIMKDNIKYGIMFLSLIGYALQALSAFLSHHLVAGFIKPYFAFFTPLAVIVPIIAVLVIEVSIRVFGFLMQGKYSSKIPNMIFGLGFGLTLLLSMILTTLSPSKIAVENGEYVELETRNDADILPLQEQVKADQEALKTLGDAIKKREGAWITKDERKAMSQLSERISRNNELITSEISDRKAANENVKSRNSDIEKSLEESHQGFGFMTQVALLLIIVSVNFLERELETQEVSISVSEKGFQEFFPHGNLTETQARLNDEDKSGKIIEQIKISPQTVETVLKMKALKITNSKIADELGIGKGTVTKCLQKQFLEWCKNGEINIHDDKEVNAVLEKYSMQRFKELEQLKNSK